mmetsp:Transcript_52392/g.150166  ORF Transcript_52392/g.150166 Transcript_52392/m.150166 type:complete len:804 (-) Transcript_52392:35-2446(-)
MGKQGFDQRTALANALNTSGVAKAPPPKKEAPAPAPVVPKKKEIAPEPVQKTKKDFEDEQRQFVQANERQRAQFYVDEAAKKVSGRREADSAVTYVEDKDSRKPKAVSDLSDYWKSDIGILPFTPDDNVGAVDDEADDVDPQDRLEFLSHFNEKLEVLLRLKFHVFWSQFIYDDQVRRSLDSYLRFCLRSYDVSDGEPPGARNEQDLVAVEEEKVAREVSRRVLALYTRLSRSEESAHEFISDGKFANVIYDNNIFDIPKLIDLCAIYGDSNRIAVTKIVHSIFGHQPLYKDEFEFVVEHMLGGLHQCCEPLQQASGGSTSSRSTKPASANLSVQDCMAFLPDILSCFNAIFCFFPEECLEKVIAGKLEGVTSTPIEGADGEGVSIPLADLMVELHDALMAMSRQEEWASSVVLETICTLLSRLLGLVLGYRMAPRRGASAFQDLLGWLGAQSERSALLNDLGKHGLESTAMEWLASGLVDDAQLDFLEELCGPVLPAGERKRGRRVQAPVPKSAGAAAAGGGGASGSVPPQGASADASASDRAKIREVREVVGNEYGEGFVLQCLLHFGSSAPAVVGALFDGSLPPQLKALPQGMTLMEALRGVSASAAKPESQGLSAEEKRLILGRAQNMDKEASEAAAMRSAASVAAVASGVDRGAAGKKGFGLGGGGGQSGGGGEDGEADEDVYNDDVDDTLPVASGFRVGKAGSESEADDAGEDGVMQESDEEPRWASADRGKGGKSRGKGFGGGKGGQGSGKGTGKQVQGQTIGARRKEENKARVGNHNRRDGAMRKMMKGSGGAVQ